MTAIIRCNGCRSEDLYNTNAEGEDGTPLNWRIVSTRGPDGSLKDKGHYCAACIGKIEAYISTMQIVRES